MGAVGGSARTQLNSPAPQCESRSRLGSVRPRINDGLVWELLSLSGLREEGEVGGKGICAAKQRNSLCEHRSVILTTAVGQVLLLVAHHFIYSCSQTLFN